MLVLLSPSKTLDCSFLYQGRYTLPRLLKDGSFLAEQLKTYTAPQLGKLMGISAALAELNALRFQQFSLPFTLVNAKPAIFAFQGHVYDGLEAQSFTEQELSRAQQSIRILSGLYGVLSPLDLIQPYRLEMGTKWVVAGKEDLYSFWRQKITALLQEDIEQLSARFVVNLASQEYYRVVEEAKLPVQVITVEFKDWCKDRYRMLMVYVKKMRGVMAHYITHHAITDIEQLRKFSGHGYQFNPALSGEHTLVFTRKGTHG